MPFETLTVVGLSALIAVAAAALLVVLRRGRLDAINAQRQLDAGAFQSVLDAAEKGLGSDREEILATALAAKHMLELERSRRLLERLIADDSADGEAWLELGLVEAYDGRLDAAEAAFGNVESTRSDLLESLTLHRSWLALLRGDRAAAQRSFGEVELPLETKLRQDLGEGDPAFAEWFLHAGLLWTDRGDHERAEWALSAARSAAPQSRLIASRSR